MWQNKNSHTMVREMRVSLFSLRRHTGLLDLRSCRIGDCGLSLSFVSFWRLALNLRDPVGRNRLSLFSLFLSSTNWLRGIWISSNSSWLLLGLAGALWQPSLTALWAEKLTLPMWAGVDRILDLYCSLLNRSCRVVLFGAWSRSPPTFGDRVCGGFDGNKLCRVEPTTLLFHLPFAQGSFWGPKLSRC